MWPVALIGGGMALAYFSTRGPSNLTTVQSGGKQFQVQNLPDKEAAARLMGKIQSNLEKLIEHYQSDTAKMADPRVNALITRFKPENMCENDLNADSTSYSENKGEKIVVCLREKTPNNPLIDENTIMFVILHEMAHLMTTTVGHTTEFWTNFRIILQDAVQCGIYTPVNYAQKPTGYCGMTITDSPI